MKPEVYGAFRLAGRHSITATNLRWRCGRKRRKALQRARRHESKVQKLLAKGVRMERE